MRRFLLFLAITSFTSVELFAQGKALPKTYAVVVGITKYQNQAIPALQFADRDAQQFSAWLQSKSGGEIPQDNIKLLVNNQATIAAVYDALDWLKTKCKENDVAYIYFSGHGDVETKNKFSKGFLLAYNSPQSNYANNAIRIEDINNESITLTTKNRAKVIIITDACHSGKLAGDFYKGKQLVASQLNQVLNNQVRIASCKEDQLAAEGPNWGGGRGVFSYYLVLGLQGLAAIQNNRTIQLDQLADYLKTSFAADKYLAQSNTSQNPVSDGNPYFAMATKDDATLSAIKEALAKNISSKSELTPGLMALKPLRPQPIDDFFAAADSVPLESFVDFETYGTFPPDNLAEQIVKDCITWQEAQYKIRDTREGPFTDEVYKSFEHFNIDTLHLLSVELKTNPSLVPRFLEKFVQMVQGKGQAMINAYLQGDASELERRQYYYSGNRDYKKYLSMLHVAMKVIPPDDYLVHNLSVQNFYLTGLIDRMQMATTKNTDSLLHLAFKNQQEALKLQPDAAYILNEIGNLYLHQKQYKLANENFSTASIFSPTWAIPWSNKIRLNLASNNLADAEKDFLVADLLQPNLAFVLVNAGLVMEQRKNILAAESYYLRAIKKNNVHYLAYERLANIYLNTGEYDKANYYFFETKTRKKDFAINDEDFKYGVELGGIGWNEVYADQFSACGKLPECKEKDLYFRLYGILSKSDSLQKGGNFIDSLDSLLTIKSSMPLVNHYLGKKYYRDGNFTLAQKNLEKSIATYLDDNALLRKIAKDILGENFVLADTCKVSPFLNFQFDVLEDRYMLAAINEKNNENDKALTQYDKTAAIENRRQMIQAGYVNYADLRANFNGADPYSFLVKATENPIVMFGAIKASRLHQKLGEYEYAEQDLLKQVVLSRAAGNERQNALNEKRPGWNLNGTGGINFYWLSINSYLESETYNFYKKMLEIYPRDAAWNKKAGLFLHSRLLLAFDQAPVEQYKAMYKSIGQYAYPWKGANESQVVDYHFAVPNSGDSLKIVCTNYNPVKEALSAMLSAIKFSGDMNPDFQSATALADLYSWIGEETTAITWYQESLKLKPNDLTLRNRFVNYLTDISHLPEASSQLQILHKRLKTTQGQIIHLANWQLLAGQTVNANALLQKIKPKNTLETWDVGFLRARTAALEGKNRIALDQLQLSVPSFKPDKYDTYELREIKESRNTQRLYFMARLNALLNNNLDAINSLKQALDGGFNNKYVLDYDRVWNKIKNSSKWKVVVSNTNYDLTLPNTTFDPINYRIPGEWSRVQ